MDEWQKQIYKRLTDYIGNIANEECKIILNFREAYVLLKALEGQQRYLNPVIELATNKDEI